MSKEIYISSTPRETRLAVVENEKLSEIYYERENEYTLAGSIYNGKVTRVLPGMQSSFVDIGLERDAFLYVTDFMEEQGESAEFESVPDGGQRRNNENGGGRDNRSGGRGSRDRGRNREQTGEQTVAPVEGEVPAEHSDAADANGSSTAPQDQQQGEGSRRWRGRRGRRRGRGDNQRPGQNGEHTASPGEDAQSPVEDGNEEFPAQPPVAQPSSQTHHEAPPVRENFRQRSAPEASTAPVTPIVLPGESLSKYRKDAPAPQQPASSTPAASTFTARPSTLIEVPLTWDGGAVLPGESRSVRPRQESTDDSRREHRGDRYGKDRNRGGRDRGPRPDPRPDPRPNQQLPIIAETHAAAPVVQVEYEPEEASASHRINPVAPSEFRQTLDAPVLEEVFEEEIVEAAPLSEEAHGTHEFTSIHSSGDMVPELPPVVEPVQNAAPVATTLPVEEDAAQEAVFLPAQPPSQTGSRASFAPGTGEIEEELMEEEEFGAEPIHALTEDAEFEDLEEETLEGAADLGSMLREMSIDDITRPEQEDEEDEDEDELSEEMSTDSGLDEGEETEEAEVETPGGDSASADAATPVQRPRRDNNRRGNRRFGGRQRRGPGGGRRTSMQSTNLPAINDLLKPGQEILVQIAKEPIAKKGARITSHIALPGRFLVFMPTVNHIGVSRKIGDDNERRRLKQVLLAEKGEASGGFIVRTAADGASDDELRADLRFLINLWDGIKQRSESSKAPALLYHDLNLVERILRDQVTDNFSAIWVDTEAEYERVLRFLQRFQPALVRRVKLYSKETPLFEQFGITEEINKALRSKVWLKSGGSIVINQTEALVAIDINTGKYVGKTARLEDTILKTNLDSIPEIVRQIRLRDLGGIIVIDFIDMDERKNRNKVMAALEEELKNDRAPSKVLQFNDFGLVAITRKRVKQSLERTLSMPCTICTGTGMVKNPVTVCNEIYVELRKMHHHLERGDVMLRVHPEVVKQLKTNGARWLQDMEELVGKTILVKSDPALHPEQFDIH